MNCLIVYLIGMHIQFKIVLSNNILMILNLNIKLPRSIYIFYNLHGFATAIGRIIQKFYLVNEAG